MRARYNDAPIVEQKRRPSKGGNPPLVDGQECVKVCVSLPETAYDRLYRVARDESISIPEVIRRSLDIKTSRSD